MELKKVIAEEILAEQEKLESDFRAKIREKIRAIAAVQTQIAALNLSLNKAKQELKEMSFTPLDGSLFE